MAKTFTPKVLTANHLLSGDVIYVSAENTWVSSHALARLFSDEDDANAALAFANSHPEIIVGSYLADATSSPDGPVPSHFREAFRSRGPSNYAHGKQAEV